VTTAAATAAPAATVTSASDEANRQAAAAAAAAAASGSGGAAAGEGGVSDWSVFSSALFCLNEGEGGGKLVCNVVTTSIRCVVTFAVCQSRSRDSRGNESPALYTTVCTDLYTRTAL
jgi:hypothetical protein